MFFVAINGNKNNNMKHLNNYHQLCEILNYDAYLVASVISHFNGECSDDIFIKLQNLNIEDYDMFINQALDLPIEELKLLTDEACFRSESSYIKYLQSLLELNNIEFIEFKKKEVKSKFITGSLF